MLALLAYGFAVLALGGLAFNLLCLLAAWHFSRQHRPARAAALPVSILKPLKGCEAEIYEALRSHCLQEYPEFEVLFGVNSLTDEAVPVVEKLQKEFPRQAIRLLVCGEVRGANRKVSNLTQMLEHARHPHILINDSDIRVPAGYLQDVMAWFAAEAEVGPDVGMVTCLYRAALARSLWTKVESLGISLDFIPGALTARMLEGGVKFGLGSTLAMSRKALEAIGGLQPLVNHLADDYELGHRIAAAGFRVIVPQVVVETALPEYRFHDFFLHQLRWGRTVRSCHPAGYAGLFVTFGLMWAALAVAASGGATWSWALLGGLLLSRVTMAVAVGHRLLQDPATIKNLWLLPLRDLISPLVWLLSLGGSRIVWRGEEFVLQKGLLQRKSG